MGSASQAMLLSLVLAVFLAIPGSARRLTHQGHLRTTPTTTESSTTGTTMHLYRLHGASEGDLQFLTATNMATLSGVWRFIDEYAQGDPELKFTDNRDLVEFTVEMAEPNTVGYVQFDQGQPDKDNRYSKSELKNAMKRVGEKHMTFTDSKDMTVVKKRSLDVTWYSFPKECECLNGAPLGTVFHGVACQWKITSEVSRLSFTHGILYRMLPKSIKQQVKPLMAGPTLTASFWRKISRGLGWYRLNNESVLKHYLSAVEAEKEKGGKPTLWRAP